MIVFVVFVKQKTAYEMRISDWSSDVCSSDLDGSEAYTKAGDLQLDATGQLRTASGYAVLGDGGPISLPQSASTLIGNDGTISMQPLGSGTEALATVGRLSGMQAAPDQLDRKGAGEGKSVSGRVDSGGRRIIEK